MKRGADRQLTKDEDDDIEEVSGDSNFSKADDAILATRKIKGMPRRMAGSPSSFPAPLPDSNGTSESPATPPPSKFSSFSGFGTPSSTPNPFSFTPPTSSPSFPPAGKPTSSIFGPNPGTPTPSMLFGTGPPAVAPTASNAAKTFASFLGGGESSSKPAANSALPTSASATTYSTPAGDADDSAVKYYSSLRGLNVSILAAITKAIDQDPFADVASLLSRYSSLRVDVQKEFDGRSKSDDVRSSAPSPSPFNAPQTPAAPLKMPAAPTTFAGFGKPPAAATGTPPPKTNGAADAPAPPSNPFSFSSSSTASTSATMPKPSVFAPSAGSPFGTSSSSTSTPFGSGPPSSMFGSGASTTASPFGAATSPSPFGGPKPTSPSMFGGGAGGFGSSSTAPPFSFGGGGGSIGNPVGFGFGSPKGETASGSGSGDAGKEKGKDGEKAEEAEGDGEATEPAESQETDKTGASDEGNAASKMFSGDTPSGLDVEGEGEEDEDTVQSARIKAFRLQKKQDGSNGGWAEIGIGFLRLKKHKETSARRLLLRASHTGKITINFALYSGLKVSQSKRSLTLVGHDAESEAQTYSLRFPDETQATEFNNALQKEIAQVKAS
ncbi:hypothetical protein C8R43DRAFT_1062569 [Mycena crocata]|nr:hypothetical protein C8R43DRAFT_1062569 [Mycena crocata]